MDKTTNSSKRVRRIWPIVMMVAGVLCCVRPLIAWILSWHAKTFVEATSYNMVIGDWPLIPFGFMLTYLAVLFTEKRSKLFWAGIACFGFTALIGLMSYFPILLGLIGFVAALNDVPKLRVWRVMVALICTCIIITIWIMSLSGMHWPTPRSRAAVVGWYMKEIASSLEAYRAQHHEYPPSTTDPAKRLMWKSGSAMPTFTNDRGTTDSPANFFKEYWDDLFRCLDEKRTYAYHRWDPGAYIMISAGPNCVFDIRPEELDGLKPAADGTLPEKLVGYRYDPTNGEISEGDIFIVGPTEAPKAP
ncbi:MAG: hypothetical protein ABFD69_03290 [Candidatus Sumerlaeia bacterium]